MTVRSKKIFVYGIAFLIPVLIMLCSCIVNKTYPFGKDTLLISDCDGQYVNYFSYFKSIFTSNDNFWYTFSKNLGGDMIGLYSYYIASPLNFILFLFDNDYLPVAIFIIILIKIGLSGVTFNYLINVENNCSYTSVLFSTSYALIGYNMVYFFNLMWLDGVILLPLMILGINQIFEKEFSLFPYLYMSSLCIAIITNYYIGFMLCIFSLIYFIYKLFLLVDGFQNLKLFLKKIYSYIIFSVLSVGLSCFLLIPTLTSLLGGKAKFSWSELFLEKNYSFIDIFAKLFTSSISAQELVSGLPNIFSGILVTVLIILYFLNSKIRIKERLLSLGILLTILMSFYINTFNLIWHGFNFPIWFPYRYSFVFSFLLIYFSYKSFLKLRRGISYKQLLYSFGIFFIITIIIFKKNFDFSNIKWVCFDLFLFSIILLLLYMYLHKKSIRIKGIYVFLIASVSFFNLLVNSTFCILKTKKLGYTNMNLYVDSTNQIKDTIETVKLLDNSFYRLEKTFFRSLNDSMQFSYNGMTHYSSCEKDFIKEFMEKMGFRNNNNWAYYGQGTTVAAESFLGLKYLLSKIEVNNKPYEKILTTNNTDILINRHALPIGFIAEDKIVNVSISSETNPFIIQNNIWMSLTDSTSKEIFTPAKIVSVETENLNAIKRDGLIEYTKVNSNFDAFINYKINNNKVENMYAYLTAPQKQNVEIILNGKVIGKYFDTWEWSTLNLGKFSKDNIIDFSIKVSDNSIILKDSFFYYESIDALNDYYNKLSNGFCSVDKVSSSHLNIKATVIGNDKRLLLTIPYEPDWQITVDGIKAEKVKVFDALMSIPIEKGEHIIELKYTPRGLYIGVFVSILSLLVLIIIKFIW